MKVCHTLILAKKINKIKSLSSMRNGRFHPSKCKGKVQKSGEETLKGLLSNFFLPAAHFFGLMWSTHVGWFQHLPALPKLPP
jgi:hypothetical protein